MKKLTARTVAKRLSAKIDFSDVWSWQMHRVAEACDVYNSCYQEYCVSTPYKFVELKGIPSSGWLT
jgi:hypothetical protein